MLGRIGAAMVVATLFVAASGSMTPTAAADSDAGRGAQTTDAARDVTDNSQAQKSSKSTRKATKEELALMADRKACEQGGGLWVNGFCEEER